MSFKLHNNSTRQPLGKEYSGRNTAAQRADMTGSGHRKLSEEGFECRTPDLKIWALTPPYTSAFLRSVNISNLSISKTLPAFWFQAGD